MVLQQALQLIWVKQTTRDRGKKSDGTHFIAVPVDLTNDGPVAGEPFKCASPASIVRKFLVTKDDWSSRSLAGLA
jgi:hypothetical protein